MKEESKVEEIAYNLVEKGKQRADWFESSAEVVLASTAKYVIKQATENAKREQNEKLEEQLTKHFGPKCDEYEAGCMTCEMWEDWEEANTN